MDIQLSENIKRLRKTNGLTQEQLAEVLGVTVGAVYKWESKQSMPEIKLLVEMAEFFETSVDALLGYGWEQGSMGKAVAEIKELRTRKAFDEAAKAAEKALLKYPNSFEVVYESGKMYKLSMDPRYAARAIELLELAEKLMNQNSYEDVNIWTIKNDIADCYVILGQYEKAVELLKKNNYAGLNSGEIGEILAMHCKRPEEALVYLSEAMSENLAQLHQITLGYANAYGDLGCWKDASDILKWMLDVTKPLRMPGVVTWWDKSNAMLLLALAECCAACGELSLAEAYLRQAIETARRFDAAPVYTTEGMKFYHGRAATAYDDFGVTAMEGIERALADLEEMPQLYRVWQGMNEA